MPKEKTTKPVVEGKECLLTFTVKEYKELKELYEQAEKEGKETFKFKEKDVLTKYAHYMLEYLNTFFQSQN